MRYEVYGGLGRGAPGCRQGRQIWPSRGLGLGNCFRSWMDCARDIMGVGGLMFNFDRYPTLLM